MHHKANHCLKHPKVKTAKDIAKQFVTVRCMLCREEFPQQKDNKDQEPCQKKRNLSCFVLCRAFNASGMRCGNNWGKWNQNHGVTCGGKKIKQPLP
jgi:hypothetical protein